MELNPRPRIGIVGLATCSFTFSLSPARLRRAFSLPVGPRFLDKPWIQFDSWLWPLQPATRNKKECSITEQSRHHVTSRLRALGGPSVAIAGSSGWRVARWPQHRRRLGWITQPKRSHAPHALKAALVAVTIIAPTRQALSAAITVHAPDAEGRVFVDLVGTINDEDFKSFKEKTDQIYPIGAGHPTKQMIVTLVSYGGYIGPALQIGDHIRKKGMSTFVPGDHTCTSACALIWLAGRQRNVGDAPQIGFHAIYDPSTRRETGTGNAVVGAYLRDLGIDSKGIVFMTRAGPTSVEWLTPDLAKQHGVAWAMLQPPRAIPIPPQPKLQPRLRLAPPPQVIAAWEAWSKSAKSLAQQQAAAKGGEPPIAAPPKMTNRIEPGTQQAPAAPAPAQGQVTPDTSNAVPTWKTQIVALLQRILGLMGPAREFSPGDSFSDCDTCPMMTVLPAGNFVMGSPPEAQNQIEAETPVHLVALPRRFAVGRFEVTNSQYAQFLSAMLREGRFDQRYVTTDRDDHNSPLLFRLRYYLVASGFENHPVTGVSWPGAKAYVQWLSTLTGNRYRLLTEAEWEYAARAGTQTKYYFGEDILKICEYGNIPDYSRLQKQQDWVVVRCTDGYSETAVVGKFKPNSFGLYDMLGNVWEWVEDCWHSGYYSAPSNGDPWTSGGECAKRVVRGGSFDMFHLSGSAARLASEANDRVKSIGFRVAREIEP
jgi:sulfatase modifying factor 1